MLQGIIPLLEFLKYQRMSRDLNNFNPAPALAI